MILNVADALKATITALPGIAVQDGKPQVFLGIQAAWPSTPAAEVIPSSLELRTYAAGQHQQLATGTYFAAFYVAVTANLEDDERKLIPIVEAFLAALRHPNFDRTLGGAVEDVRPTAVEFDVVKRSGKTFRAAVVQLVVGDDLED